jgi:3-hydroxyisobutyrate dehydrogenase
MGMPMCTRLVAAGFEVTATDVRAECREPAQRARARWADSIAEACASADILITMLPGAPEVGDAAAGIVSSLPPDASWLDMSSGSPEVARHVAALAAGRGVRVLDAPVGGGPAEAGEGALLAFAGGTEGDLERCRPALQALTAGVLHVGAHGAGYAVKLLVNLLWFGQAVATAEALALAGGAGLDLAVVTDALRRSSAGGRFLDEHAEPFLSGEDLPAFPLARCLEELDAALQMGRDTGVPLQVAVAVAELHRAALERYGDVDGELLGARLVAERGGLGPPGRQAPSHRR